MYVLLIRICQFFVNDPIRKSRVANNLVRNMCFIIRGTDLGSEFRGSKALGRRVSDRGVSNPQNKDP